MFGQYLKSFDKSFREAQKIHKVTQICLRAPDTKDYSMSTYKASTIGKVVEGLGCMFAILMLFNVSNLFKRKRPCGRIPTIYGTFQHNFYTFKQSVIMYVMYYISTYKLIVVTLILDLTIDQIRLVLFYSHIFFYDLLLGFFVPLVTLFLVARRIPLFLKNTDIDVSAKPIPFFYNFQVSNPSVPNQDNLETDNNYKESNQIPIFTIKLRGISEMPIVE